MSKAPLRLQQPVLSVTGQEEQRLHMIQDHELTQMASPGTGILGSIGFMALGTALGLLQSFVAFIGKIETSPANFNMSDLISSFEFIACAVLAIVCLLLFGIQHRGKRTLAQQIRARPVITQGRVSDPKIVGMPISVD